MAERLLIKMHRIEASAEDGHASRLRHGRRDGSGRRTPLDLDIPEDLVLPNHKLVEFHEFEKGEKGHDNLRLGGGGGEKSLEALALSGLEVAEQELDLV